MTRDRDALDWLLPDVDDTAARRARDVTRFLRLLTDDASPARACTVGVDYDCARRELEHADRVDLEGALCDLLRHHLHAAASEDSFVWCGEPALDARAAWRAWTEVEGEGEATGWTAIPAPGEGLRSIVDRLLAALERLDPESPRLGVWRARVVHVFEGPRAAEPLYREERRRAAAKGPMLAPARHALAGVAECLLERGAPRDARTLLVEALPRHGSDVRLRQLLSWARLALGDAVGARAAVVGLRPWSGSLPAGLARLRDVRREWLPCLAGRVVPPRPRSLEEPVRDRHDAGASLVAVFAFAPAHGARAIHVDAAPGLRERLAGWLRRRDDAHLVPGSPEHVLVRDARVVSEHGFPEAPLRHAVSPDTSRALVLVPVRDDEGEVAGWLHVECEHHLLPGEARLAAWAAGWRTRVLVARERIEVDPRPVSEPLGAAADGAADVDSPVARAFARFVERWGVKLQVRRFAAFSRTGDGPELVLTGGTGDGFADGRLGRGRALARAVATHGVVVFDEPDDQLAWFAGAASGFALPITVEGRPCGYFLLESSRRRDFRERDVEACRLAIDAFASVLRAAQFAEWHARRFAFAPWFDAARPDFRAFTTQLVRAARAHAPVVLSGAPGTGKLVLARRLHFESGREHLPIVVHTCGLEGDHACTVDAWFEAARGGTLVLDDVDRLAPERQEELLRRLERVERATAVAPADGAATVEGDARLVAITSVGLAAARDGGRLRADLAARLDRLTLLVPRLCERREEIPGLFTALLERFAAEEDRVVPTLTDEALALVWRQRWEDNVRGLENLAYKLVLLHGSHGREGGEPVTPEDLARLGRRFGLTFLARLPSRHPDRRDLIAALRSTRVATGRWNKTRASAYLGWDPDTLVARMASEGIGESDTDEVDAWSRGAAGGLAASVATVDDRVAEAADGGPERGGSAREAAEVRGPATDTEATPKAGAAEGAATSGARSPRRARSARRPG